MQRHRLRPTPRLELRHEFRKLRDAAAPVVASPAIVRSVSPMSDLEDFESLLSDSLFGRELSPTSSLSDFEELEGSVTDLLNLG